MQIKDICVIEDAQVAYEDGPLDQTSCSHAFSISKWEQNCPYARTSLAETEYVERELVVVTLAMKTLVSAEGIHGITTIPPWLGSAMP